jgi:hypothetical protein
MDLVARTMVHLPAGRNSLPSENDTAPADRAPDAQTAATHWRPVISLDPADPRAVRSRGSSAWQSCSLQASAPSAPLETAAKFLAALSEMAGGGGTTATVMSADGTWT